jgi:hypothetical protein
VRRQRCAALVKAALRAKAAKSDRSGLPQKLRQLRDIRRNPPRLIAREQLCR